MMIIPIYQCRNCRKTYPGNMQEIANTPLEKLVSAARYTLGSQDHSFRIAGKTVLMSDLHQCSAQEIGVANLTKIKIETEGKKE